MWLTDFQPKEKPVSYRWRGQSRVKLPFVHEYDAAFHVLGHLGFLGIFVDLVFRHAKMLDGLLHRVELFLRWFIDTLGCIYMLLAVVNRRLNLLFRDVELRHKAIDSRSGHIKLLHHVLNRIPFNDAVVLNVFGKMLFDVLLTPQTSPGSLLWCRTR